jgi:probable rRNA maturation factor
MDDLVEISIEDDRWIDIDLERLALKAFSVVLAELELSSDWQISVLACDESRITVLNSEFRDKPKATNVLSWPAFELAPEKSGDAPILPEVSEFGDSSLGDIAISFDTCQREADAERILLTDHVLHLLIHGCLHLLGYDHETDADAQLMEGLESHLLEKMGIADPYRNE